MEARFHLFGPSPRSPRYATVLDFLMLLRLNTTSDDGEWITLSSNPTAASFRDGDFGLPGASSSYKKSSFFSEIDLMEFNVHINSGS